MKKLFWSVIFALIISLFHPASSAGQVNYPQLSREAQISLMTCGPGVELYSMFGHSALWINDPVNRIDRVYNYGTFDFNDENFYYKFIRGIADYKLSITNYQTFTREYIAENRSVRMQPLNLTLPEKQALFEAVEENYLPENRYYRYDFFFMNCSSLIRDRVFNNLNSSYQLDQTEPDETFRDLLQPYVFSSWVTLGVNFLLGHQGDRVASNWERMFLPDHMHDQFEMAKIESNGILAPSSTATFLSSNPAPAYNQETIDAPFIAAAIVFLLIGIITRKRLNKKNWNKLLDSFLFLISGIMGMLLLFVWLFSEHEVMHQNINILWAFPLHIFLVFMVWIPRLRRLISGYAKFSLILIVVFLALAALGFQQVPWALILFAGAISLRLFRLAFLSKVPKQIEGQKTNN